MRHDGTVWALMPVVGLVFALAATTAYAKSETISAGSKQHTSSQLIELTEDNWQLMLTGEWMVEFFAPWCPACKNLAPTWEKFAWAALDEEVNVAKIDVTTSPSLSGRFFVTALPTLYHVKDGEFRQYRGSRDGDALMLFLRQKQWVAIEPISAWKKPDTIHMSILSYFFKLSHTVKDYNQRLQEEYGLPTWGSYALFAIGTIFVGAALGLILVCIVDFLYPPKKANRQSFEETRENARDGYVEDLANDELEDDDAIEKDDESNAEEDDDEENADDNEEDENIDDEEDEVTSEGEKFSQSDSEEPESDKKATGDQVPAKNPEIKANATKASPSEVRKRKPRKAD